MNILQINTEYVSYTIHTYQLSTEASAVSSLFKIYLCSLISMPLLVKAMALERTSVAISSIVIFIVQTLKSMRTEHTSYSILSRRVKLEIGLVTLKSVVLHFV